MKSHLKTVAPNPSWSAEYLQAHQRALFSNYQQPAFVTWQQERLQQFLIENWPTRKQENWRYAPLHQLINQSFSVADNIPVTQELIKAIDDCRLKNSHQLVFIDGYYCAELSDMDLAYQHLANIRQQVDNPAIQLFMQPPLMSNRFTILNQALCADGAYIYLTETPTKPVQILHYYTQAYTMHHICHCLELKNQVEASIIETHHGHADNQLVNQVVQINQQPGSILHYYKLQQVDKTSYYLAHTSVYQQRDSQFNYYTFTAGSSYSHEELHNDLAEHNASCRLFGIYQWEGKQHGEHYTTINHQANHNHSEQHYKGVMRDNSYGVFNGRIIVEKNTQQTAAHQLNNNVVLSPQARVNTKPELEIYNDDVSCSHGATVGQLDEAAIWYLRSRGISQETAKKLLLSSFIEEILSKVTDTTIRYYLEMHIK